MVSRDLFSYTERWADIGPQADMADEAVLALERRDQELEYHLKLYAKGTVERPTAAVASSQIAAAEVVLASLTLEALPYPRLVDLRGVAFITGAATTPGVAGDVWEIRAKLDGVAVNRQRWYNPQGSSWQQSVSASSRFGLPPDVGGVATLTIQRVAGSGGCRTFLDGTTNYLSAAVLPQVG